MTAANPSALVQRFFTAQDVAHPAPGFTSPGTASTSRALTLLAGFQTSTNGWLWVSAEADLCATAYTEHSLCRLPAVPATGRAQMKVDIAHKLEAADAKARMKELGEYWHERYGIEPTWSKDSAQVAGSLMGFAFDARLDVAKNAITIEGCNPNFLIRTKIIGYLEQKMSEYLDAKTSLTELEAKRAKARGRVTCIKEAT